MIDLEFQPSCPMALGFASLGNRSAGPVDERAQVQWGREVRKSKEKLAASRPLSVLLIYGWQVSTRCFLPWLGS